MRKLTLLALALSLGAVGCVKTYTIPTPEEPHAIVKIKVNFNKAKQIEKFPGLVYTNSLMANLSLREINEKGEFSSPMHVMEVRDSVDAAAGSSNIETFTTRLMPNTPVELNLWDGIFWQTRTKERVQKIRRIPERVQRNTSSYNPTTKRTEYKTEWVTEYKDEYYWEDDWVIKDFSLGCSAQVRLTPKKDEVYLLDYTNQDLTQTCTAQIYRQTPKPGGGFQLTPIE